MFDPQDRVLNRTPYTVDTNGLPPYVIFAFDSSYSKETLSKKLAEAPLAEPHEAYKQQGVNPQPPIDAVCVLGKYVLWNLRQVDGPINLKANGQPARGWLAFDTAAPLSRTLSWLQLTMPRIVRNKPVFGYYLGKKTLVGAKKFGDLPEGDVTSPSVDNAAETSNSGEQPSPADGADGAGEYD